MVKILAIDGGGIRGIIPATVLMEIERRTGKPAAQLFDLIAGTSTGGILAAGLVIPGQNGAPEYTASALRDLYLREARAIFPSSFWRKLARPLAEKYSPDGLERVLRTYFGQSRLKDSLCNVLVTSYEIKRREPWFFRTERALQDPGYDFPLWQVARATSAAPTYFPPAKIETGNWTLIDGGTYANNPAMCAYAEIRRSQPDAEILMVSLGTGRHAEPVPYHAGLLGWASSILDIVFDGASRTTEYELEQLLPAVQNGPRYYRFQTDLRDGEDAMDNTDPDNLRCLVQRAEGLVQEKMAQITELCAVLTR